MQYQKHVLLGDHCASKTQNMLLLAQLDVINIIKKNIKGQISLI